LSVFNGTAPNGNWNLFVLDEFTSGTGSISGGWSVMISTVPAPPFITTKAATNVKSTSATLNGTINPLGANSSYAFQIGPDTTYSFVQDNRSAGSGTDSVYLTVCLTGLDTATIYYFRLTFANPAGVTLGSDISFTTAAWVDTDNDGMPNDYETSVGLNPSNPADANIDSDGDGMTNLQEYLAGTNPMQATSVLRITSVQISGGDVVVTFPSVLGKTYRLEQRTNLTDTWMLLTDNIAGTGDLIGVPDVEAADQNLRRFYRITVMP
jgi:hypothetical protein